jgi:hypothetical protein
MAVAKSLVEGRFRDFRSGPAQLSADLEAAWGAELRAAGHDDLVSDLSVSPREFLLGGQEESRAPRPVPYPDAPDGGD